MIIIFFFCFSIIFNKLSRTSDSDPALPGYKTFVESQIIAITPFFPISINFCLSILLPMRGLGSIFQSPVCKTVPNGVFILSPLGSRIE